MADEKKPTVTGISPAEGPPGTIVKIRGENLGNNENDILGIFICNMDCSYTREWKSSRLIHARTGMGFGMGDIIVFTKSGGMGTSLVKFRGYMPRVGLLTEAAVWVDESKLFEEKPTTTLSNRRNFSTNSTYTDPLGVAPEETGAVLPADKIEEWYPKSSSNPLSEEFNPSRFLLERHLDTSFDSLKSGYYHLQSKDTRTSVGPASFVRGHLTTILEALHTLNEVNEMHAINESESLGGNICDELQGVLKSCHFVSDSLFQHILSRKDDADSKRNVLNVLHRYRFLFNLPRSIEKSIQQREYEILISDYNRAKALFQNTEVHSFQQALSEVDQKISAFSTQLKQKLFDFPTPLEEQKKIIRYLNDLDYPGNAGWECITKQALWIKSMLLDCQVEHQMKEGSKNTLTFPPAFGVQLTTESQPTFSVNNKLTFPPTFASDMRERSSRLKANAQQALGMRNSSEQNFFSKSRSTTLPEALQKIHADAASKTPPGILMVESLCELITENLSDLWNLGQTYLSKQLGEKKENTGKAPNERDEFQEKVKDVIVVFCEMVQTVLQPDEFGKLSVEKEKKMKLLVPWLPGVVKSVRSTLDRLNKLGLAPDIIAPLRTLTTNAIGDCIKKVLTTARDEISNLSNSEYWVLDYSQADYCISQLPGMFEKSFLDSVRFARDYMADAKMDVRNEKMSVHEEVIALLGKMIEAFLLTMEKTVYPDLNASNEQVNTTEDSEDNFPKDMQVLVLLSNCDHVTKNVIPRAMEQCAKNGFEDIQSLENEINAAINKLDERVFRTYVAMKGEPLVGEIELGINQAEFNWDAEKPVEGVRRYIQEILMNFTVIHHQVSSVSTLFTERIFEELCDMITDEVLRIFECIDKFSTIGALQAHLELHALKHTLGNYMTVKAKSNIDAALKRVPTLRQNDEEEMETMMSSFKTTMRYQLATFNKPEGEIPSDPRDVLSARARAQSMEMLDKRKISTDKSLESRDRSNTKFKQKGKKKSTGYKIEVEKSSEAKPPVASLAPVSSEIQPNKSSVKKTKRRAPAPPSALISGKSGKPAVGQVAGSNPFDDAGEDGENNPFLDDGEDDESGNPFLDGDDGNPFLDGDDDDDDDEKVDTSNPFL